MAQTRAARGGPVQRVRALVLRLQSPDSGVLGQGARFIVAGGFVVAVYIATTTVLADVVGLPFELALAIGYAVMLVLQFTLYRAFVWRNHEGFALPVHHQAGRYLAAAAVVYGLTALSTSVLPKALGVSAEAVYLVTLAAIPCVNFLVSGHGIFHAKPADADVATVPTDPMPVPVEAAPVPAGKGD